MVVSKSTTRGSVRVDLAAAPAGGWDIASVSVNGRVVPPTRKGEFATDQEAEDAAFARAEEFAKQFNLDKRY